MVTLPLIALHQSVYCHYWPFIDTIDHLLTLLTRANSVSSNLTHWLLLFSDALTTPLIWRIPYSSKLWFTDIYWHDWQVMSVGILVLLVGEVAWWSICRSQVRGVDSASDQRSGECIRWEEEGVRQTLCPREESIRLRAMGWLRCVGSLKLWVSFAEYRLSYRALLQKRSIISRSLRIVATPYISLGQRGVDLREVDQIRDVVRAWDSRISESIVLEE